MCFLHKIGSIFSSPYHSLNKKDDDIGIEDSERWKQDFSIENVKAKTDYSVSCKQVKIYAREIIRGINFPITDNNFEFIKFHLIDIAKQDDYLRQNLIDEVEKINTEKEKIKSLQSRLIGTYSKHL